MVQARHAQEADRSGGDAERRRDILVWTGGRLEEQHAEHDLAALRQADDMPSRSAWARWQCAISASGMLASGPVWTPASALVMDVALVAAAPFADTLCDVVRMSQAGNACGSRSLGKLGDQIEADGLKHVGRFLAAEALACRGMEKINRL